MHEGMSMSPALGLAGKGHTDGEGPTEREQLRKRQMEGRILKMETDLLSMGREGPD